jgi:DNA end-binding protein Ku
MAAKSIWKGNISFGLVNIPVQVYSAVQREEYTSFDQLCKKEHKIKYKKWCPVEEREVPWSEIKRDMRLQRIIVWYWKKTRLTKSNSSQLNP